MRLPVGMSRTPEAAERLFSREGGTSEDPVRVGIRA